VLRRSSPLAGEVGWGGMRLVSALFNAPLPNPPRKGEGIRVCGKNLIYSHAPISYTHRMESAAKKLIHASVKSQLMQAILGEHFRFATLKQAQVKLASLATEFILPKQKLAELAADAVLIWIKDFQVTEAEAKQGHRGNFAIIHYKTAASVSRGGG